MPSFRAQVVPKGGNSLIVLISVALWKHLRQLSFEIIYLRQIGGSKARVGRRALRFVWVTLIAPDDTLAAERGESAATSKLH